MISKEQCSGDPSFRYLRFLVILSHFSDPAFPLTTHLSHLRRNWDCLGLEKPCPLKLYISPFPQTGLQTGLLSGKQQAAHILLCSEGRCCRDVAILIAFYFPHSNCSLWYTSLVTVSTANFLYCDNNIMNVTDENAIFLFPCNPFFIL